MLNNRILTNFLFFKIHKKKTNQLTNRIKLSINNVNSILVEIIQGIKDVKLSSNEEDFIKKFDEFYKIAINPLKEILSI